MTPLTTINLLRVLFVIFVGFIGISVGIKYEQRMLGLSLGLVFSLLIVLVDRLLKGFTLRAFSSATFGLLLGLLFATLLRSSQVLRFLPPETEWLISLILYTTFGFLGMMLAVRSNRDEFSLIIPYVRFARQSVHDEPMLVDTNIVIDGRVIDICATGFLSGNLIVPRFVLKELQMLADSADTIKRERGRRGLENLKRMQSAKGMTVNIHEGITPDDAPVDSMLINLARMLQARLLSNDSNLCKVARLQGLSALNLNELSYAMRSITTAGDELELSLVKEGRDSHQAVGYLPDGTMIVVNNAREHIGKTMPIVVAGTLLTSAGRLIFAELKGHGHTGNEAQAGGGKR